MAKWTDYTIDTNPTDTDEVMTLDADKSPKANKRVTLSTLADYFLDKLASNVFAKLETQNKTVIGALNELNSKTFSYKKIDTASYFEYVSAHKNNAVPQICICEKNDKMTDRPANSWMSYCLILSTDITGSFGIVLLSDDKLYLGVNADNSITWKQIV